MAAYVDPLFASGPRPGWPWRQSCHLWADDLVELMTFAQRIGLHPEWLQEKPGGLPHFDLHPARRRAAVAAGALEVSLETLRDCFRRGQGVGMRHPKRGRLQGET